MGSNVTPDNLRGFLVPSKSFSLSNIWDAQSSYTQKNPRAGIPEAQQLGTNMHLKSIGEQTQDITITTQQGGLSGIDARYSWTDAQSNEYGRDWKNILTHWDFLRFSSGAALNSYVHTDATESVNGTLYFVTESITSANLHRIVVSKKERGGAVTTLSTLYSATFPTTNTTAHPAIEIMQDGSIVVAYFNYTTATETNITVQRSYDGGSSWQRITTRGLVDNINVDPSSGYTIDDMRFARNHSLTLWIELTANSGTNRNRLAQYESGNSALSFRLVGSISSTSEGYFHAARPVVFPDGDIGCAYIDSTTSIKFRRIPSSAIRLSSSDWSSQEKIVYSGLTVASSTASELQNGDLCIWYQDSRCFILAREYNTGKVYGFVSDDQGDTWDVIAGGYIRSLGDGLVYDSGAASMQFNHMVATPFEGRTAILAHANNSLHILYFGGYSTIGYPALVENATDSQYSRWETTWNPVAVPSTSSNWGTTGAGTQTINANGLDISTLSNNRYYSYSGSFPADYSEAWMIRFRVQIVSATNKTLDHIAVRANQDDGANSRTLKIRFAAASFDIRDNSSVLTTVTHDMTQDTEFVIVWLAGTAKISYRHVNSSHAKSWTTYTASIPTYATGAGNSLDWGHINTPFTPTSLQSYWREFYVSTGAPTGDNTEIDYNPASYPSFGEYVYIDGGLRITTQSNPARGEDAYLIEPRYDNPIDNVFHQIALSPRLTWRSAADLTNESIAWYIDPVVQASSKNYHGNSVFGIYLGNINWRTATLQKWDGAGWTSIMPIDTSSGLSSTFERAGHSIQCDTTGSDFYLHRNEAANWRCILESGGTEYPVKLKASTEGVWGKNTDTKRAILMIDTSITDPSTLPTSGNIKLMPDSVCLVLQGEDDSVGGEYAYRLFISSQDTVEGYYQIGSLVYGQVMMVAPQYQRGRVISYEPNIQEQETLDGMYYARKMSNGKRNISVAWTEPIDTTQIYLKDPNYWQLSTISGSHPIANYGDAPLNMLGVAEELSGTDPLIYLPSLAKNQNRITLNRMMDHMYCRISGGVSIESVLGEEEESELWRVATVNLVEIE